jgi:hypothetical protein
MTTLLKRHHIVAPAVDPVDKVARAWAGISAEKSFITAEEAVKIGREQFAASRLVAALEALGVLGKGDGD